ncbi:MAG TPA: hypothetical protein PLZ61_07585, partial [Candidatus Cryosericum sp.]|nr:hypothetical protein [Candidatus Cryosericum sp.]
MKSHIRSRLHVLVWCLLMSVAALVVATHGANAAEAPTLTLSRSSATYLENDAGFFVDGDLSITGYSGNIDGARVFIDRGYRSAEDSLQFTPSGGINGSFQSSTGILTLSGSASASAYQTVLRSVRYVNGSDNPTT